MIQKFLNKRDLLVEIAKLYYIDRLNQKQIAEKFKVSRSNISKLIKKCWQENIIDIRIDRQNSRTLMLESKLRKKFNLNIIKVIPTENNYQEILNALGREAAKYLESILRNEISIGISWGTSLFQMVDHISEKNIPSSTIIEIHGGLSSKNILIDGTDLGRALARKLNSTFYSIHAPLIVQSKEVRDLLYKEPNILQNLQLAEKVDIAFLGIGTSKPELSALRRGGYVSDKETKLLYESGAVGMVCGYYYDRNGDLLPADVNNRIISLNLKKIKTIPITVGVAAGELKADAILGALKGGYINSLFTDETAATMIIEKLE